MWFKEILTKDFKDQKKIDSLRFSSIKNVFVFSILLFFLNFFILGSNINFEFYKIFLPFTYYFLLLSMLFFFYYLIKIKIDSSKWFYFTVFFLLLLVIFLLFLPFVFRSWIMDLMNFVFEIYNKIF